jgi:hypothetical protein
MRLKLSARRRRVGRNAQWRPFDLACGAGGPQLERNSLGGRLIHTLPKEILLRYVAALLLVIVPAPVWAQWDSTQPSRIPLTGFGGVSFGYVMLGTSHPSDVQRVLDSLGGLGPKRDNKVTFVIGQTQMRPPRLYTPPATMNQLYFRNDVLVLVVEGIPRGLPGSRSEFMARYPGARETHRESAWYELQTQLSDCLWLIAVFGVSDDKLQSDGYAYTCGQH